MRCKNCGLENDDNLYICQNCGSPLYDEADINDEDSTVEFKKIGGSNIPNENDNQNNNDNQQNNNNDEEEKKKKQLTTTIIVLCVVLVAIVAGVIGAVIANNNKDDEITTTLPVSTTVKETTTQQTTTKETTTNPPIIQYMVTVRATEGGSVDGGGQFTKGDTIKITAKPNNVSTFLGWYTPNGVRVSQSLSYTFVLSEDVIYEAKFETPTIPTTQKQPEKPSEKPSEKPQENPEPNKGE